ncbi:hypothetical protein [Litchfieldia salsa]|uniref:GNAT family N-acetyltransferase n=1 Tax=Litchfieldia salsa TaxID=930152 RepID=A0A1H0T2D9_9BACI|nr:hypothetical protein SAMN05216565_103237 [Litchfieldia salsa]
MTIRSATTSDAPVIHALMIKAFTEYKNEIPPSSALEETVQSVSDDLQNGEKALIAFEGNNPIGIVRYRILDEGLFFIGCQLFLKNKDKVLQKRY